MPRIRSIKPGYWSDEKISKLSHGCMAFFIGLWNFCDDEGKVRNDPKQLNLWMPVFRTKDIVQWLVRLEKLGLVCFSVDSQWVLVTNWDHQKISKPHLPDVKKEEIQWLPISNSRNVPGTPYTIPGKDKDRIGKDNNGGSPNFSGSPPSAWLFNFGRSEDCQKWERLLTKSFDDHPPGELIQLLPRLAWQHRADIEAFRLTLQDLMNQKIDDEDNRRKYMTVALKRSLGLLREAS